MGEVSRYVRYAAKRTVEVWDWVERVVGLTLAILTAVGYLGVFFGWWNTTEWGFAIGGIASIGLLAFLGYTFLFIVPARTYADAQPPPFDIEFYRVVPEVKGGNTWLIRLNIVNNGPAGPFEAELVSVSGGSPRPTTEIPLPWSPDDEPMKYLDEFKPRWVLLGEFTNTYSTQTDPPRPQPPFYYRPPPDRKSIACDDEDLELLVVVRNYESRQFKVGLIRVWADGDRMEAEIVS